MAEIERITTVWDARFDKLEEKLNKAVRATYGAAGKVEKRLDAANTNINRFFGKTDPARALDKVFDNSRLRLFDSATARIGLTGSALELLGPAGLAAAAGVAAIGAAFAGAREAARFADDISDTAKRLHVTTDALQEYRYAIRAAGGEEKGADEALEGFSVALGKAQQGLTKSQRAFLALGFTKDQIKGFTDADEALKAVTERIAGLPSQQKDAIIAQLGLDGLKPLIEDGIGAMTRLRTDAHKVGIVMDADLVKRGAELNDQFETVSKVIDVQLKSALVDVGPVLVGILQQMANLAKLAADVADAFRSIENKRTDHLKDLRQQFADRAASPAGLLTRGHDLKRVAEIDAELNKREIAGINEKLKAADQAPTHRLVDTSKSAKARSAAGPRDDTAQRLESINAALAGASRDLLQAQLGLTDDIEARAAIERDIATQESAQDVARLQKQKADLAADKGFTGDRDRANAELDLAIAAAGLAATAKAELITRNAALAIEDRQIEVYKLTVEAQIAALEAEVAIATTAADRLKFEKRILDLRQQLERDLTGTQLDRDVKSGAKSPEQAAAARAGLDVTQAAARSQFATDHRNPIDAYLASVQDLNTELQTAGVQAFDQLADSLASAILNAKSLGEAASNVFAQLAQQILSDTIKSVGGSIFSSIKSGFTAGLTGHAMGTDSSPGGLKWVGERGPELLNIPRGAQVIPNDILRSLAHRPVSSAPTTVKGDNYLSWTINTPNADSFRRTERQTLRRAKQALNAV